MRSVQRLERAGKHSVKRLPDQTVENLKMMVPPHAQTSVTLVMEAVENTDCV